MGLLWNGLREAIHILLSGDNDVWQTALRSLLISGAATAIAMVIGIGAGAALAFGRFPGRNLSVTLVNTGMGLPPVWLGIEGSDQDLPTTSLAQIVASRAVEVHAVAADSPAASAGIQPGDLLVSLEGQAIDSMGDLVVELRDHEPGEHVDIGLLRDGEQVSVGVTLGAADD